MYFLIVIAYRYGGILALWQNCFSAFTVFGSHEVVFNSAHNISAGGRSWLCLGPSEMPIQFLHH